MSLVWSIAAFILVLTPIILVHELGHFIAARLSGIKVEEFGLGFPPRAKVLFERAGTIYSLNWIPVGGFVRPAGEDDPNVPGGLASASKRARLFTLAAGSGANVILAVAILWVTFMVGSQVYDAEKIAVTDVRAGTPAEVAGLVPGDIFVEAEGTAITDAETLTDIVADFRGREMAMVVDRDGQLVPLVITPRGEGEYDPAIEGPMGIGIANPPTGERLQAGPIESLGLALQSTWDFVSLTVRAPAMLISGELSPSQARPVSVIGISQIAGRAAESTASTGDWSDLLGISAAISIALGLTNLLPLPALDGGRILFVLIEALRGRRIAPEREGMVHVAGMILLLGLMVILMIQDVVNPIF